MRHRLLIVVFVCALPASALAAELSYLGGAYLPAACGKSDTDTFGFDTVAAGSCMGVTGSVEYETAGKSWVGYLSLVNFQPGDSGASSATTMNFGAKMRSFVGIARGQYRYNGFVETIAVEKDNLAKGWSVPVGFGYQSIMGLLVDVELVVPLTLDNPWGLRTSLSYRLPF